MYNIVHHQTQVFAGKSIIYSASPNTTRIYKVTLCACSKGRKGKCLQEQTDTFLQCAMQLLGGPDDNV